MDLKNWIKEIPNWPKPGIVFKDISPLLENPEAFQKTIDLLAERYKEQDFTKIIGIESRGFIFGAALAYKMQKSFVLTRKKGKLPPPTLAESYSLEYGEATLEIKTNSLTKNDRVLIIDDVIATGGTFEATKKLVEKIGAQVLEGAFLLDIRKEINSSFESSVPLFSLIKY